MSGTETTAQLCKRMYQEEDWIDWLLGNKPPEQAEAMRLHTAGCRKCRDAVNVWKPLLAARQPALDPGGEIPMPSPSVHRSLRAHVKARKWRMQATKGILSGRKWIFAAAACAIMLGVVVLQGQSNEPKVKRSQYVAEYEPRAVSFMNDPQTDSFSVHTLNSELGKGYVWYNPLSGEVLLLLEGMFPSDGFVIQAWVLDGPTHRNLGVLRQLEASRAHLYFKDETIAMARNIALTVEPHGGSQAPTSPDAFVIRLQQP
ncbi:anti-sigma factor [Paenibacillus harenae]|uniref:anti-sigma factor n=1 Tax=Paenibacillus harenae TaxID=306543 RepID=UPI0004094C6F|nr:anti-sigma factor [Paenibacillus harenae]